MEALIKKVNVKLITVSALLFILIFISGIFNFNQIHKIIDFSNISTQAKQFDNKVYTIVALEKEFLASLNKDSAFYKYEKDNKLKDLYKQVNDYSLSPEYLRIIITWLVI